VVTPARVLANDRDLVRDEELVVLVVAPVDGVDVAVLDAPIVELDAEFGSKFPNSCRFSLEMPEAMPKKMQSPARARASTTSSLGFRKPSRGNGVMSLSTRAISANIVSVSVNLFCSIILPV
jgi:hypothetical protein